MAIREIIQLGNPLLWEKSERVISFSSDETRSIIEDLSDTLRDFQQRNGFGRAISAVQIGAPRRIIFVNIDRPWPLINPEISWASSEQMELWDDCFSFPTLMVRVLRAAKIRVDYQDIRGERQSVELEGGLSELLQHEIDHLDGILAVDRAIDKYSFCTREEYLRRYRSQKIGA